MRLVSLKSTNAETPRKLGGELDTWTHSNCQTLICSSNNPGVKTSGVPGDIGCM